MRHGPQAVRIFLLIPAIRFTLAPGRTLWGPSMKALILYVLGFTSTRAVLVELTAELPPLSRATSMATIQ